ncbi:50S ribosomal protein L33 [Candidatus Phytoplasma luffae]|uniref:50S ribosomal protein L33 n=1 Tax=Loofah witches'-broom phytoplasma TaxID=35773 RepID=UPI002A4E22DC|nr:50S ribosomal protein L33 [Candidatus Phytoplasma luffae]
MLKCLKIDVFIFDLHFLRKKFDSIMKKNILICNLCLSRNYHIKAVDRDKRLNLKKYCPNCNKHVSHEESR